MGHSRSGAQRLWRYHRAVQRQIAAVQRQPDWYAPVEEFLRPGDTVEAHLPQETASGGGTE